MRLSLPGPVAAVSLALAITAGCARSSDPPPPAAAPLSGAFEVPGLSAPVRVVRDRWGIPHITAGSPEDLFIAQGFVQASDRLFQMDLWRRAAQGRLAEVLGANFVSRDAMTRRIQYRGNPEAEWASYAPDAQAIATAFVRGVNAWVEVARARPPEAFVLAGWLPERWRAEDLLNRTDAFVASGDGLDEVFRARLVTAVGPARAGALLGAGGPIAIPRGVDPAAITFQLGDLIRQAGTRPFFSALAGSVEPGGAAGGSNAWAIAAERSAEGGPILAADPHRLLSAPSPRYLVHLTAPGWNVIGAASPWLPGVVIGHNERIAWAMTSADIDTMDLFVERLNPDNRHQVEIDGQWRNTVVVRNQLFVKGRARPIPFDREYTPNGVVVGVDRERQLAFTLRWSGMEPGGAGELAALAVGRAQSAGELREALRRWKMPAAEFVYAERGGGIGTQVAALVPRRAGGDGRLPAAGWGGGLTWTGWQPLEELPHSQDPAVGAVWSANQSRARLERLRSRLGAATDLLSVEQSWQLQHDLVAWNAERLVPLLAPLQSDRPEVDAARRRLIGWNREVSVGSEEAALFIAWEEAATRLLVAPHVPPDLVDGLVARAAPFVVGALTAPSAPWFGANALRARDALLLDALGAALAVLEPRGNLAFGREVVFSHPLGISEASRRRFNVGPFARGGYAGTVQSLAGRLPDAAVGASFGAVFDSADWDRSLARNAPGQSGSPDSPHFADLASLWAEGRPFPLAFSAGAVAAEAVATLTLVPPAGD